MYITSPFAAFSKASGKAKRFSTSPLIRKRTATVLVTPTGNLSVSVWHYNMVSAICQ